MDLLPRIESLLVGLAGEGRGLELAGSPPSSTRIVPGGSGEESFAETVARVGALPLDRFATEGQLLEVRVPWLDVTLWFVPEEEDADALVRDGVSRGRVWTATELMDVMAMSGRTRKALRTIALAKLAFDADMATVIPRSGG